MKNLSLILLIAVLAACNSTQQKEIEMPYSKADFETVIDGKSTNLFTLKNENGMVVTLTNYGAKIVSIYTPDKRGILLILFGDLNQLKITGKMVQATVR